jgi:hypothetical protein
VHAVFDGQPDAACGERGVAPALCASIYFQGIDSAEIIDTVHARPTPTVQVNALLRF